MSETLYYLIRENKIIIPANQWFEERVIAELKDANPDYMVTALTERFESLIEKVKEIRSKFENTTEIEKLSGQINRTRSYIYSAKAIGDYPALLKGLDQMEKLIADKLVTTYEEKEKLCVAAEALLQNGESREATNQMKELQIKFRELPIIYDEKNAAIKVRFDAAKEEFFKRRQEAIEATELEMFSNLDLKTALCEKAEKLKDSTEWKATTEAYQQMNEEWKKIGFVPKHRKEELWLRFNTAKDHFFARKREHFGEIKNEQEDNYLKKLELISRATALQDSTDWKQTAEEYKLLMEEWKKTGRVPQDKSDEVWEQFMAPQNIFYKNKDEHFNKIKVQLEDNYARKMAIVQHAESIQNSENFDVATEEYLDMFEEWKTIGRIPKEHGDEPWERFLKAKKHFFDRKDAHRELRKKEQAKDVEERMAREKSYFNKLNKELISEERLIQEVNDRIANLPATLRAYEKREEYLDMLEELKAKVSDLKIRLEEVRKNIQQDERELNYIMRTHRKKSSGDNKEKKNKVIATEARDTPSELSAE